MISFAAIMSGCSGVLTGVDIWHAVKQEDLPAIRKYAKEGGDLNVKSYSGWVTPLIFACEHDKLLSFKVLLELGADPNQLCNAGAHPMIDAAGKADPTWIREALKWGGDPNATNSTSINSIPDTPLVYAAGKGHLENVRLLVEAGANVDFLIAKRHDTALTNAISGNHFDIVLFLLNHGADYLAPKGDGEVFSFIYRLKTRKQLPNVYTAEQNRLLDEIIQWLRNDGFDIDKAVWNGDNWTIH